MHLNYRLDFGWILMCWVCATNTMCKTLLRNTATKTEKFLTFTTSNNVVRVNIKYNKNGKES